MAPRISTGREGCRAAFDSGRGKDDGIATRAAAVEPGDLVEENLEEFAELESLDNGKPLTVARAADIPLVAEMFRYMAG